MTPPKQESKPRSRDHHFMLKGFFNGWTHHVLQAALKTKTLTDVI